MRAVSSKVFQQRLPVSQPRWSSPCWIDTGQRRETDPAMQVRDASPGLHRSKHCHPPRPGRCPHRCRSPATSPHSWELARQLLKAWGCPSPEVRHWEQAGVAFRLMWRWAIMEAKRHNMCASLSELNLGLHYGSIYIIQDNTLVCSLLCRLLMWVGNHEIQRKSIFQRNGALTLLNTNNFTLNFTCLVKGDTEMMRQI